MHDARTPADEFALDCSSAKNFAVATGRMEHNALGKKRQGNVSSSSIGLA
jgi:hypothetical protein